ncbi:Rhs family-like protein [Sporocytophaga myxococcoides]|uniref:Rhs family-like protein n=1 Tax=Sporocytophaga myxococcoides TaxID=153721 RepID=A0A098LH94_9BACT|nr:RHS repeat-associated core domain-containing protein [Sporocytophaga myxococcoides]GAL85782.1 Rhs family-like protein [Sporocytophaga myxococcoides]
MKGDQFSYALGYYDKDGKKDYSAIGGGTQGLQTTPVALNDQGKNTSLYNGNIATWTSLNKEVNYTTVSGQRVYQAWTQQFEYDQLNRIKSGKTPGNDAYKNTYAYDANGNITSLNRYNESGVQFDQLSYNYENKKAGYLANTNKLRSVSDLLSMAGVHISDIDNQGTDNYEYDEIGNLNKDVQEQIKKIEWTVYGKIKAVTREGGSSKSNLSFEYDASGNRTVKIVTDKDGNITKTFYIRDAQGNVMSTYEIPSAGSLTLDEQYIYGSSRLGVLRNEVRSYELTDHLGNVRSVIGELRDVNNQVDVVSAMDYYPFGMIAKSFNSNNYRYGYQSQEMDNEIYGTGNAYSFEYRIHDPRIGRFLSIDPMFKDFSWNSPYAFAENKVIHCFELEGLESVDVNSGEIDNTLTGDKDNVNAQNKSKDFSPWADLIPLKPSNAVVDAAAERVTGLMLQPIEEAYGNQLNLDYYSVSITKLPTGTSPEQLYEYIRQNFAQFKTGSGTNFTAYDSDEGAKWKSKDAIGSVMTFEIPLFGDGGPFTPNLDELSVIATDVKPNYWVFSPVFTLQDLGHPVCGNRQFGLIPNQNQGYTFFTRGADRPWGGPDALLDNALVFPGAERLWPQVMANVVKYVNDNGGQATVNPYISKRIDWTEDYLKKK